MTEFTKELIEQLRMGVNADLKVDAIYISDAEKILIALDYIEHLQQRITEFEKVAKYFVEVRYPDWICRESFRDLLKKQPNDGER